MSKKNKATRVPVKFRYDAINPLFMRWMAEVGYYASEKYGSYEQYRDSRLVGEKSPVNHIGEHLKQFQLGEKYDHFEGDVRRHLAAIAYNAMMEFYYVSKFGFIEHPLTVREVPVKVKRRKS
jgi:hypothetical protein